MTSDRRRGAGLRGAGDSGLRARGRAGRIPPAWAAWGLLLALALAAGCGQGEDDLELVGTVERNLVELVAPASETIVAIRKSRGETVAANETVVQLDTTYAAAELARAEATLAGARTGEAVARQELSRAENLQRDRVASQQALDRARLAYDEAVARLREAEALVSAANKRLSDLSLAAPVSGVLDQLPFEEGERVSAGAVVAVILADGKPWVRVWVPEQAYVRVLPGTPAEVRIDGVAAPLHGTVLDVAREPEFTPHYALTERDRVYLVYEARVRIDDAPASLRPGVPAQVSIEAPNAVLTASP